MFSTEEIQLIKEKLPLGFANIISEKARISPTTIYKFFSGGSVRLYCQEDIVEAALDIIEENGRKHALLREKYCVLLKGH